MRSRSSARQSIRQTHYDVCVIGAGATGAGCALDAQLRGLSTVLLDAGDFVSCTSSASTKLVHGGVRYLQQAVADFDWGQYVLVKKALHERIHILRCAPYLAHPLELLVPCFSLWELMYFVIGMKAYDWLAGDASLFPSRMLTKAEALRRMPALRSEKLVGAVSYADGQFDDARFGLALTQTFAQQGGEVINYAEAVAFGKNANGKLSVLEVEDQISHEHFQIRAKVFMNCTGPFADRLRRIANPALPQRLRVSKGVHLLLPLEAIQSQSALLIPKTEDGRVIFAIPWLDRLLVGTTDEEANPSDEMVATPQEVNFLLKHVNRYLNVNLTPQHVCSAFAGMRPLLKSRDVSSREVKFHQAKFKDIRKLVRDHEVEVDEVSGLISVLGGKWTTYRAMAEDGINQVQRSLGGRQAACKTLNYPLTGARGFSPDYWKQLAAHYPLSPETARHLAQKFGTDAPKVLEPAKHEAQLLQPLFEGGVPILAEVVYAIREEMAQTIEDILLRRIGVQFHSWKEAAKAAPIVAQLLAREFGWSDTRSNQALGAYLTSIQHLANSAGIEP
jgi:glycerol-3-phosphate dehydrogenase